jgi:hypothetical protein
MTFTFTIVLIRLMGGGLQLGPLDTAATDWPIVAYNSPNLPSSLLSNNNKKEYKSTETI